MEELFGETPTPKVCGPVSGLVLNCQPAPLDLATICPSSAGLALAYTQALQVMLPVICRSAAFPRSTYAVEPFSERPLPYLPEAVKVAPPKSVPVWPLPVASAVVVPLPSPKACAATRPGGVAGGRGLGMLE